MFSKQSNHQLQKFIPKQPKANQPKRQDLNLELLTPEASAMHLALRGLVAQLRAGHEAAQSPLALHVAQLSGCETKVKEVDDARALQKHYEDKAKPFLKKKTGWDLGYVWIMMT